MKKFNKLPASRSIPKPGFLRQLTEDFEFESDNGNRYYIKAGYVSDGGSIPRAFWSILPKYGTLESAYFVHDILYYARMMPRKKADLVLKEALDDLPTKAWKRKVIFNFVWYANRIKERLGITPQYSDELIDHARKHLIITKV